MRFNWVKFCLRFYTRSIRQLTVGFGIAILICAMMGLPLRLALAVMTITPINGTLPVPSPTPLTQGIQTFYYYVTGTGYTIPALTSAFLTPGMSTLSMTAGLGYGGTIFTGTDTPVPLANAIGLNVSSNVAISGGAGVMLQVPGGTRFVPIAGVGPYQGAGAACSSTVGNCAAWNLNSTVSVPLGGAAGSNAPYYAGIVNGGQFSVYFYPEDVCADNTTQTLTGCASGSVVPPPANGVTTLSLNLLIQPLSAPNSAASPTSAQPLDKTPNPLVFSFQTSAPSFVCPDLSQLTIQPDDGRIYIDASKFTLNSGTLAPGANFVVVAKDQGQITTGVFPTLGGTALSSGVNSLVYSGPFGISNYVATGFANSSSTVDHNYFLAFLIQDAAGIYTYASPTPSASPPVVGKIATQSCNSIGPIETTSVNGFLSGKHCFIATAAFGSQDAIPVELLREFRDRILLETHWGESFVEWYYSWSPTAADWVTDHPVFRLPILLGLFPLEVLAWVLLHPILLLLTLSCIGSAGLVQFLSQRSRKHGV